METMTLYSDLNVFGEEVKTFPEGVGDAFDRLSKRIPNGLQRAYYGLSKMKPDGGILYIAAAEEKSPGEAERLNYTRYVIEKGDYTTKRITSWMDKIPEIKQVFGELLTGDCIDPTKYCVEWYKSDDEMLCMVKTLENRIPVDR